MVDNAYYANVEDSIIDNNSSTYYIAAALRPSYVDSKCLRNFEIAFRYSSFMRPQTGWGGYDSDQFAAALNYWLKWNCVFKIMYQQETNKSNVPDVDLKEVTKQFIAQIVYGF
jgi:hypothetical protein